MIVTTDYIRAWPGPWVTVQKAASWDVTAQAGPLIADRIGRLGGDYVVDGSIAVHRSATIESSAILKGPIIVGPNCFVAAHCYLRGGVWLAEGCTVGPGCEVKSSFLFGGARLAHFNFVGDSIVGSDVNIEAGAIIANYRNELDDRRLRIQVADRIIAADAQKFGALVGDGARIGANAVIAPGAVLERGRVVPRLGLVDQRPA